MNGDAVLSTHNTHTNSGAATEHGDGPSSPNQPPAGAGVSPGTHSASILAMTAFLHEAMDPFLSSTDKAVKFSELSQQVLQLLPSLSAEERHAAVGLLVQALDSTDETVQYQIVHEIRSFLDKDPSSKDLQDDLAACGLLTSVAKFLNKCTDEGRKLGIIGLLYMFSFKQQDESCKSIAQTLLGRDEVALPALLQCFCSHQQSSHPSSLQIPPCAFMVVTNLTDDNPDNQLLISQQACVWDTIEASVVSMAQGAKVPVGSIAHNSLILLANLSHNDDCIGFLTKRSRLLQEGLIPIVSSFTGDTDGDVGNRTLLYRTNSTEAAPPQECAPSGDGQVTYVSSSEITKYSLLVLSCLAGRDDPRVTQFVTPQVVALVVKMVLHELSMWLNGDANTRRMVTLWELVKGLRNLAVSDHASEQMGREGVIPVFVEFVIHPEKYPLRCVGEVIKALWNLSFLDENRRQMIALHLYDALLTFLQRSTDWAAAAQLDAAKEKRSAQSSAKWLLWELDHGTHHKTAKRERESNATSTDAGDGDGQGSGSGSGSGSVAKGLGFLSRSLRSLSFRTPSSSLRPESAPGQLITSTDIDNNNNNNSYDANLIALSPTRSTPTTSVGHLAGEGSQSNIMDMTVDDLFNSNCTGAHPNTRQPRHVMLSYSWANQQLVLEVKDHLKQLGYEVWVDVERMKSSTVDAMAQGVEDADAFVVFVSQAYKNSPNCRSEAMYARDLKVPIIPVIAEANYVPPKVTGWLGFLIASRLWFDMSDGVSPDSILRLKTELGDRGLRNRSLPSPLPTVTPTATVTPTITATVTATGTVTPTPTPTRTHTPPNTAAAAASNDTIASGTALATPSGHRSLARHSHDIEAHEMELAMTEVVSEWSVDTVGAWISSFNTTAVDFGEIFVSHSICGESLLELRRLAGDHPGVFLSLCRDELAMDNVGSRLKLSRVLRCALVKEGGV